MAREEPVAPNASIAAATQKVEQRIVRHRDCVNPQLGFVIMGSPLGFVVFFLFFSS
jgi:hypothetical protein